MKTLVQILTLLLLCTCTSAQLQVGDFNIQQKVNPTGPLQDRRIPGGASRVTGTDGSGLPTSYTLGSGLAFGGGALLVSQAGLSLDRLAQSGASAGNLIRWSGSAWLPGGVVWGDIGGTLSNETELQAALDAKLNALDPSVTNARTPTGGAGGVLSGTYPNPGFAVDMAEQAELDALATSVNSSLLALNASNLTQGTIPSARFGDATVAINKLIIGGTPNGSRYLRDNNQWADLQAAHLTGATLPSSILGSSLTSVGVLSSGTWQASPVQDGYIASAATWHAKVAPSRTVTATGLAVGGGDLSADRAINVPAASQAEATTGTATDKVMTPQRTAQAIAALAAGQLVIGNTLVVSKDGNDATALRERADKPFLTLDAAKAAAVAGDVVLVYPGAYNVSSNLAVDKVYWHFFAGAKVTRVITSAEDVGVFDLGVNCEVVVSGAGEFLLDTQDRSVQPQRVEFNVDSPFADSELILYSNSTPYSITLSGYTGSAEDAALDFATSVNTQASGFVQSVTAEGTHVVIVYMQSTEGSPATVSGGFGSVVNTARVSPAACGCVRTRSASSKLSMKARSVSVKTTTAVEQVNAEAWSFPCIVLCDEGDLTVTADTFIGDGVATTGCWWLNGTCSIRGSLMVAGYYGVWSDVHSTPTGEMYVTLDELRCFNSTAAGHGVVYNTGSNAAAALWLEAKIVRAQTPPGSFAYQGSGGANKIYIRAQKIFGMLYAVGSGPLYVETDKLSPSIADGTIFQIDNTASFVYAKQIDMGGVSAALGYFQPTNGTLRVGHFVASSSTVGLMLGGGAQLVDSFLDFSASANAHAVIVTSGAVSVSGCHLIGGTSNGKDINVVSGTCTVHGTRGSLSGGTIKHSGANVLFPYADASVTNAKLANSSITINGTPVALGESINTNSTLHNLTDVSITSATTNDFLAKSAGDWVNLTPASARTALGLSSAGGVLSGTYPNPGFAVDMAEQGELNTVAAAKANLTGGNTFSGTQQIDGGLDVTGVIAGDGSGLIALDASNLTGGTLPVARIADATITLSKLATTGTASSSTYLRGDGAWTAIDLSAYLPTATAASTYLAKAGGTLTGFLSLNLPADNTLQINTGDNSSRFQFDPNSEQITLYNAAGGRLNISSGNLPATETTHFWPSSTTSKTFAITGQNDGSITAADVTGLATSATTDTTSASNITSGTLDIARIADATITNAKLAGSIALSKLAITGTPDGTKFIRDDGSYQAINLSGYLPLTGGTLTGALTLTGGTVTSAANPLAITQTWNATGVPFQGPRITITDTSSSITEQFFGIYAGAAGTTKLLAVEKIGGSNVVEVPSIRSTNNTWSLDFSETGLGFGSARRIGWSSTVNYYDGKDLIISRDGAAKLQLGLDHATTATTQTIKAHDVTTGTGATLDLSGGNGSVAGGAVTISTSTTTTPAVRMTVKPSGVINVNGAPTSPTGLVSGDLWVDNGVAMLEPSSALRDVAAAAGHAYTVYWSSSNSVPTTAASGSTNVNDTSLDVQSGVAASGRGMRVFPTSIGSVFFAAPGINPGFCSWNRRVTIGFSLNWISSSANGQVYVRIGQNAATAGDLSGVGVGLRINNTTMVAQCHNGTTLTTSGTLMTMTTSQQVDVVIQSDGSGAVLVYLNGSLATTMSGGPTTASNFFIAVDATNGADASQVRCQISPCTVRRN